MPPPAKALIVDDSAPVLLMLAHALGRYGIGDITKAENGRQAMEHFTRELLNGTPYSLVLLDIVMPLLDGQETLGRMRAMEINAGVAMKDRAIIIMVTALHSVDDMADALIEGDCSDYLVKPVEVEDIGGMLARYEFLPEHMKFPGKVGHV